jgi:hypothetical protein
MIMATLMITNTILDLLPPRSLLSTQPASQSCSRPATLAAIGLYSLDFCTSAGAFLLIARNGCASPGRRAHSIIPPRYTAPVLILSKTLRLGSKQVTYRLVHSSSCIILSSFCLDLASGLLVKTTP